jgi:hypothetical protein
MEGRNNVIHNFGYKKLGDCQFEDRKGINYIDCEDETWWNWLRIVSDVGLCITR